MVALAAVIVLLAVDAVSGANQPGPGGPAASRSPAPFATNQSQRLVEGEEIDLAGCTDVVTDVLLSAGWASREEALARAPPESTSISWTVTLRNDGEVSASAAQDLEPSSSTTRASHGSVRRVLTRCGCEGHEGRRAVGR